MSQGDTTPATGQGDTMGNIEHWTLVHGMTIKDKPTNFAINGREIKDGEEVVVVMLSEYRHVAQQLQGAVEAADDIRRVAEFYARELDGDTAQARAERLIALADRLLGGHYAHQRRQRVLAALTDHEGNPKPWLTAEEIGYSPFCEGMSVRQIAASLSWLGQRGFVSHSGLEWKLTELGLALTRGES